MIIVLICLLVFSLGQACYRGSYVDYNDIAWSPDNKHIAFSFYISQGMSDYAAPFPHEAVAYIDVDDTLAQPVVITPPIDRAFVINDSQIVCWSELDGWFMLDMNKSKIGKNIGELYSEDAYVSGPIDKIKQSSNQSLIAGMGYDFGDDKNVVICWNFDNFKTIRLTEDTVNAIDFCWKDSITVLCKNHINDGQETIYIQVNVRDGRSQHITQNEYEKHLTQTQILVDNSNSYFIFQSEQEKMNRIHFPATVLPANPVISWDKKYIAFDFRISNNSFVGLVDVTTGEFYKIDSGWNPQFINNNRILYHHNKGFGIADKDMYEFKKRKIYYPRTAHHPQWISESVVQFRVGRADITPEPYYENPSSFRSANEYYFYDGDCYYLERDSQAYYHDELWQVNIKSGEIQIVPDVKLESILRVNTWKEDEQKFVSPNGQKTIHNHWDWGVSIREIGVEEDRKLLSRRR
ncbi:MAG: hypothetical protein ABIK61_06820 [candidate division WOR-3 bacterium]